MPRKRARILRLCWLASAWALGCAIDDAGGTQGATTSTTSMMSMTSTTSTTSGDQSGSVTSAPGSATDETVGDSAPTMATATTTTASATSADPSSTGAACEFPDCDDMMDGCDIYAQDCPEGQKCAAYISGVGDTWDAVKCFEVTGTDEPGDPCISEGATSGVDSCIKGAMCWGVDMNGIGECEALCSGSFEAPVCEDKGLCTTASDGVIPLCLPACDPLLQDCPDNGEVCYPIGDGFTCAPDASGDEGQANDPCEFVNVCDEGLMCAITEFAGMGCELGPTGCCTPFCKFPDGACPNPDQQCVQYFEPMQFPADDPWLDIGVCGVPG